MKGFAPRARPIRGTPDAASRAALAPAHAPALQVRAVDEQRDLARQRQDRVCLLQPSTPKLSKMISHVPSIRFYSINSLSVRT